MLANEILFNKIKQSQFSVPLDLLDLQPFLFSVSNFHFNARWHFTSGAPEHRIRKMNNGHLYIKDKFKNIYSKLISFTTSQLLYGSICNVLLW